MNWPENFSKWKEENDWRIQEIRYYLHLIRGSPLTMLGLLLVTCFILIAVFADYITPYSNRTFQVPKLIPPSSTVLFGSDDLGRDIYSRVIHGSRISLRVAIMVVVIAAGIGVPIGLISGFYGSWVDELIMRITDIFLSIPTLVLAVMFVIILGPGINHACLAVSLILWTRYARLMRGQALWAKEQPFIEAARSYSASKMRIIFKHILPNSLSPLIVQISYDMGQGILYTAALSFLGIGARPPTPEWGLIIATGRNFLPRSWWFSTMPGLAIILAVLGFNLLGDGLRDIFDPRLRK